jgi:hypothetical protein
VAWNQEVASVETAKMSCDARKREKGRGGRGGLGLNPKRQTPMYPDDVVGPGWSGQQGHGQLLTAVGMSRSWADYKIWSKNKSHGLVLDGPAPGRLGPL